MEAGLVWKHMEAGLDNRDAGLESGLDNKDTGPDNMEAIYNHFTMDLNPIPTNGNSQAMYFLAPLDFWAHYWGFWARECKKTSLKVTKRF